MEMSSANMWVLQFWMQEGRSLIWRQLTWSVSKVIAEISIPRLHCHECRRPCYHWRKWVYGVFISYSLLFVFMLMFLISTDRDIHEMHTHMHMNSYVGGTFLLNNCSLVSRPPEAAFHLFQYILQATISSSNQREHNQQSYMFCC